VKRHHIIVVALWASLGLAADPAKPAPKPATLDKSKPANPAAAHPGGPGAPPEKPKPLTPEETKKALYVFGTFIAQRTPIGSADLTSEELDRLLKGFSAAALNQPLEVKPDDMMQKVQQLLNERAQAKAEEEKKKGATFLEKAATESGAQKLPSGVDYTELAAGTGPSPAPADTVSVHYKGTLVDGKEFDSSYKRGAPAQFRLDGVIRCWTEGVGKMKVGGKSKLVCPSDLAYGERGRPGSIPANSVLVFEVELLGIPSLDSGK
jgi:FKBP-type peptidyl-prolyl cis-trans isomerase FkpA